MHNKSRKDKKEMNENTQVESTTKYNLWWKLNRFFTFPKLWVSLLESPDRMRAITLWGVHKNQGSFMMDEFDVGEKENVQSYFTESISFWKILKMFIGAIFEK